MKHEKISKVTSIKNELVLEYAASLNSLQNLQNTKNCYNPFDDAKVDPHTFFKEFYLPSNVYGSHMSILFYLDLSKTHIPLKRGQFDMKTR